MQTLQYDLRCPAAKDNSITHAAAAPSFRARLPSKSESGRCENEAFNSIELNY